MMSKRSALLAIAVTGVACLAIALASSGVRADRPFDERSLEGPYHFATAEIRETGAQLVFCNAYGIIEFDGAGGAEILAGVGYGTCSDGSNPVEPNTFLYQVFPDGSLTITEQGTSNDYTTHCQIVDKGKLVLCDGTGGIGGTLPSDQRLWITTGAKL